MSQVALAGAHAPQIAGSLPGVHCELSARTSAPYRLVSVLAIAALGHVQTWQRLPPVTSMQSSSTLQLVEYLPRSSDGGGRPGCVSVHPVSVESAVTTSVRGVCVDDEGDPSSTTLYSPGESGGRVHFCIGIMQMAGHPTSPAGVHVVADMPMKIVSSFTATLHSSSVVKHPRHASFASMVSVMGVPLAAVPGTHARLPVSGAVEHDPPLDPLDPEVPLVPLEPELPDDPLDPELPLEPELPEDPSVDTILPEQATSVDATATKASTDPNAARLMPVPRATHMPARRPHEGAVFQADPRAYPRTLCEVAQGGAAPVPWSEAAAWPKPSRARVALSPRRATSATSAKPPQRRAPGVLDHPRSRGVAQSGSAQALGACRRGFKSRLPDPVSFQAEKNGMNVAGPLPSSPLCPSSSGRLLRELRHRRPQVGGVGVRVALRHLELRVAGQEANSLEAISPAHELRDEEVPERVERPVPEPFVLQEPAEAVEELLAARGVPVLVDDEPCARELVLHRFAQGPRLTGMLQAGDSRRMQADEASRR